MGLHERTLCNLRAVVGDLVESLILSFPECSELPKWCEYINEQLKDEHIQTFVSTIKGHLLTTLPYKMVKYDRAVSCITGSPLNVYQIVVYRELEVLSKLFPQFACLQMKSKIEALPLVDQNMFWQFVHEAMNLTLRAMTVVPPTVPTPDEIGANIERRRRQKEEMTSNSTSTNETLDTLPYGVDELWKELCLTRNVPCVPIDTSIKQKLISLNSQSSSQMMISTFSVLGTHEYIEESLAIADRMINLCMIKKTMPRNMMNGIEQMASSLVNDLNNGTMSMDSLNIEEIGKKVMNNVDESEMSHLANNLDRILPIIQSMGMGLEKATNDSRRQ